jgi:hypothetical protein
MTQGDGIATARRGRARLQGFLLAVAYAVLFFAPIADARTAHVEPRADAPPAATGAEPIALLDRVADDRACELCALLAGALRLSVPVHHTGAAPALPAHAVPTPRAELPTPPASSAPGSRAPPLT